jgi:hypothetical protein
MFHAIINTALSFGKAKLRNTALAGTLLAGGMLTGMPTAAFAHHHGFHVDVVVPGPEVVVPAPCDAAPQQVWVAPVYQTVTERVWVEPVVTTQIQRVEVPAQYGWRDVGFYDYYGRAHVRHEQVQICPAHCEDRPVQVVVCPGHFENQTRQQLICDGHWETQQPAAVVVEPARARIEFPLPF